jgi:hypothetical protein
MDRIFRSLAITLTIALVSTAGRAATIATATYDNDSYMFVGTNNEIEPSLGLTEDYSAGVVAQNNAHFIFGVVKFGNLAGLTTKSSGGGEKYLQISTSNFPGPSSVAVSIALADIDANDLTGYPSPLFPGNRFGLNTDRLRWYMNNIKGNNAAFGGYAGGAPHVGVMEFNAAGTFYLKVTDAVDAWISGTRPNYGFGLWGISVSGEQGNTFDLASANHPSITGPVLVNSLPGSTPLLGDTNLDGLVNRRDLAILAANFGRMTGAQWSHGDFDDDRRVSLSDLGILQSHWTGPAGSPAVGVPEPTSVALVLCLAGFGACVVFARRKRTGDLL